MSARQAIEGAEMSDKDNPYGGSGGYSANVQLRLRRSRQPAQPRLRSRAPLAAVKDVTTDGELCRRRHPGIAQAAGAGRFLGAVVRAVQAAAAGAGKGGRAPPAARSSWSR